MGLNIAIAAAGEAGKKQPDADGNKTGQWVLLVGPLLTPATKIKTEKGPAIYSANASFIYVGGTNGNPSVALAPILSQLELKRETSEKNSSTLKLMIANRHVLVKGDEIKDEYENTIKTTDVSDKLISV